MSSTRKRRTTASEAPSASPSNVVPELPNAPMAATVGTDYLRDATERSILFLDTLRQRGNLYNEHLRQGEPALLKFDHELVLDGRSLPQPCNYLLLRLLPPAGSPVNPKARPLVVVDPRAGHGPGIGGFKDDSEVGMAMRAGHPVYFVAFTSQPEPGQTLLDVMQAEARFLERVVELHPKCTARPAVIGNCQAGWAMAMLATQRPELFGPLMLVGAPLSYWAGGSQLNPMRYSGATLGGAWLAAMTSDLSGGRFDGANLVDNFEKLNPANTLWGKHYRLWSKVDTESERFLEFERWWGGIFRMNGDEIEAIVENLFVGNKLARGELPGLPVAADPTAGPATARSKVDLRNITSPILVFASWGDNITPPPQALNWIIDVWGSERAIAAAGRVIVYVLHETVGHLGIFVGGDIARKEHDQIVNSMDVIEHLPPGLYEMKVRSKNGVEPQRWEDLEPGSYTVNYEHRTMDALRAINPEGRDEERLFSSVAKLSEVNTGLYKTWLRPWIRLLGSGPLGDALAQVHPLRVQHRLLSDQQPGAAALARAAERVRQDRHALPDDHPGVMWERTLSSCIENSLNLYRDLRDQTVVQWTRLAFGPLGFGAWFPPDAPPEEAAAARAEAELAAAREEVLRHVGRGGFAQAVCRIVLAGMVSIGAFERRSFRLAQLLAQMRGDAGESIDWQALLREEARIAAVAPVEALNALGEMLPDPDSRERALALAAAVMMIEPTLQNPRSEIIELLIGMLDLDPERVIELARRLTSGVGRAAVPTPAPLRRGKTRSQAATRPLTPRPRRFVRPAGPVA